MRSPPSGRPNSPSSRPGPGGSRPGGPGSPPSRTSQPAEGEQRQVEVIEGEHLVPQHRQAVEVAPGRSWCSRVPMRAWSEATWVSRAIPTRSRNRRDTRSSMTRRNHRADRRHRQPDPGQRSTWRLVAVDHALRSAGPTTGPSRASGRAAEDGHHHGEGHQQASGLGPVAEPEHPPQRRDRRRQLVEVGSVGRAVGVTDRCLWRQVLRSVGLLGAQSRCSWVTSSPCSPRFEPRRHRRR